MVGQDGVTLTDKVFRFLQVSSGPVSSCLLNLK